VIADVGYTGFFFQFCDVGEVTIFQFCDVGEVTIIHKRISPNLAIKITEVRKFKLLSIFRAIY
jgi:hypothetical protein